MKIFFRLTLCSFYIYESSIRIERERTTLESNIASSLCRFRLRDEELITDEKVKEEIALAFNEGRGYEFYLDGEVIEGLRNGTPAEMYRERFFEMRDGVYESIAAGNNTVLTRLASDTRLSSRVVPALMILHRAVAAGEFRTIESRRFVIIKERPGKPTIYHLNESSTVIAHVGQGPEWTEIPTIYLGLKTFDAMIAEQKRQKDDIFKAFTLLLGIEERAIETGYAHAAAYPPDVSRALTFLVDSVIEHALQSISTDEGTEKKQDDTKERPFTDRSWKQYIRELDARVEGDELNFDYERCVKTVQTLERLARRYKRGSDRESLIKITRLLVAASGHDIHEVRNRANLALERILSPKEYDAPLATRFINVRRGEEYSFSFDLPEDKWFLRLYHTSGTGDTMLEEEMEVEDLPLTYNEETDTWDTRYRFTQFGQVDFLLYREKKKNSEWVSLQGTSGRVNVIPDVRGEIILEIFTDIHGHSRLYWQDQEGNTGLVYNEYGEVIRLGRFSDITAHLDSLYERYRMTAIYVLGAQKRGSNYEDWAPEASSPSPFSPHSLVELEPSLGGDEDFRVLVDACHQRDIKVIVDIIPHVNRQSTHLPDELVVKTYDGSGNLVPNSSTDGRYGSWNDGKLLNYRRFEIWQWLAWSIHALIDQFDIDGIRFDSAHAIPIMMKRNNYPMVYGNRRNHEDMLFGDIIVNERENDHLMTTGYYDSASRDLIAVPLQFYLMRTIEQKVKARGKKEFLYIAECFWGHERFLARSGIIPYNSSLFKICENIIHGKTDVREIYHIYDSYFPSVMPEGTELLGVLGNHDERRALNTFGHRGLRAAVALTIFMSNIIMDYEGSAEGEGWKVYLDNIYVNWNHFEYASNRSLEQFYREWYRFQREEKGRGVLLWANNTMVAAAAKFTEKGIWVGAFNFSDANQNVEIQFDNPALKLDDNDSYRVTDPLYSPVTRQHAYYTGAELKISRIHTVVSYTERVKLLQLIPVSKEEHYNEFLRDSFERLYRLENTDAIESNFAFIEMKKHADSYEAMRDFLRMKLIPLFQGEAMEMMEVGLKRGLFHLYTRGYLKDVDIFAMNSGLENEDDQLIRHIGERLQAHNRRGTLVFMSAEAEPFSKSGGLANVVYELPRELVAHGERVCVITGLYRNGDEKSMARMRKAMEKYNVTYTGINVHFKIMDSDYSVGVHSADVEGITYYMLDHHEFFDGLYWGVTSAEKLRRRVAFARACAEVITTFELRPHYCFTNDAFAGIFTGIVRSDPYYEHNHNFARTTYLHIIHNGGWQYFDAYTRWENGFDLFNLFNLPSWRAADFTDPVYNDRLNCMATGIRFSDRVITVSPSYARQIEYASDGMEHILSNVIGISNAIGRDFRSSIEERFAGSGFVEQNSPLLAEEIRDNSFLATQLEKAYPEILKGPAHIAAMKEDGRKRIVRRMYHKLLLQKERGLTVDPDAIIFTMIHRISEQKGFQLLLEASEGIFKHLGIQTIIGGAVSSGDQKGEEIAHGLYLLSKYYPRSAHVSFGFQDVSIPLLASDLFGMPSMHEPGGISQLEAFSAGCLVVARATGGLRDTVHPVRISGEEVTGNGFLFSDYSAWAFYDAMERASIFFHSHDDATIDAVRRNAEESVYYWDTPAREYIERIYSMTETIRIIRQKKQTG